MSKSPIISPYVFPGIKSHDLPKNIQEECVKKHFNLTNKTILRLVAENFQITEKDILSKSRKVEHVNARYLYYACIKLRYGLGAKCIGGEVGNRDHSSVLHGFSEFANRYQNEFEYRDVCNDVFEKLSITYSRSRLLSSSKKNW